MNNEEILRLSKEKRDYVIECRRTVHRYAELGGEERKTSRFIRQELEGYGLRFLNVGDTGLIAALDTGKEGPHILLRADMDALPIQEAGENLAQKRNCISENKGNCHACGHDAHTAMLLGTVRILSENREKLTGAVYACFESGEETGCGVRDMIKALKQFRIDTCWALHVYSGLESGRICVDPGARMAGTSVVDLLVKGRGGHGARPDLAENPVFCAALMLSNLAAAWPNQIDPNEMVTLGITRILGGDSCNIIPETARIGGTLRFFNEEAGRKAVSVLRKIVDHTAEMNGCKVEYKKEPEDFLNPVINDRQYAGLARKRMESLLPKDSVVFSRPWCASETFAHYTREYPGVFAYLGIRNEAYGSGAPHHSGHFDVDEEVLVIGVMATLAYVDEVRQTFVQGREGEEYEGTADIRNRRNQKTE